MPVNSTTTPSNNTGVIDVPIYQDWMPEPRQIQLTKSINISSTLSPFIEPIQIKDVIGLYPSSYQFRLLIAKTFLPSNVPQWIVPFIYQINGIDEADGILLITQNGNILQFPVTTANTALLPIGVYRYRQLFTLQARKSSGLWSAISSMQHETILSITNDLVVFNPKNNFIDHIIGTSPESVAVSIDGNNWKIVGNYKFVLSSENLGVLIQPMSDSNGNFQILSGSGPAIVNITLNSYFDIVGDEPYIRSYDALAVMANNTVVNVIAMRVLKFGTEILTLSPNEIFFVAEKNINVAAPQNLLFECNVPYQITSSPWLITEVQTIFIDGVPTRVIIVAPLSSSNLDAGTYQGFVKVSATINGELEEISVAVTYTIIDIAMLPYEQDTLAFTLDNTFIECSSFNPDTYMQLSVKIKSYDFYTDLVNDFSISEKIGLFKGKARVNIGKTIHQIMNKSKEVNENVFQYKSTVVSVEISEIALSDNVILRTKVFSEIKFLAGLSNFFNQFGFLKLNHQPERVTINSYKYINFFVPSGIYKFRTFKNDELLSETILDDSENKVMTFKVEFLQFQQGDKIEYQLVNNGDGFFEKVLRSNKIAYIVFPEGMYTNHINWEDEFLLKQAVECTGDYTIKGNLEFISQTKYVNLVEHLSHLEVGKVSKITINTGWVMQSDRDMIESLMRSKKVWINAQGKTIYLVPISEQITKQDSAQELIEYTIEFRINPDYNEQTHSL